MSFVEQNWFELDKPLEPYFFTKHHDLGAYELFFIEIIGNQICIESGKRDSKINFNMYTPISDAEVSHTENIINHANQLIKEKCLDGFTENKKLTEIYKPIYLDKKLTEIDECGMSFKKSRQFNNKRLQMMLIKAKLEKENRRKSLHANDYDSDDLEQIDINNDIREEDLFGSDSEFEDETWNNDISTSYEDENYEIDELEINTVITEENHYN